MKILLTIVAIVVLLKIFRRIRYGRGSSCRGRFRRGRYRGGFYQGLAAELDLTDDQAETIREQVKLFRAKARSQKVGRQTRDHLAAVIRSESFDENILGELFASHDDALRVLRLEAVERLAAVHSALDPAQRESLAQILESGRSMPQGGPFR